MLDIAINALGAACVVMVFWRLARAGMQKPPTTGPAEQILLEDYLRKITLVAGLSVYDTFCIAGEDWQVPTDRIERDFSRYLSTQTLPYYVKDFVRKSQVHVDELYRRRGPNLSDKRMLVFYVMLTLLFWGGAVFLCVYVLPGILPSEEIQGLQMVGPP